MHACRSTLEDPTFTGGALTTGAVTAPSSVNITGTDVTLGTTSTGSLTVSADSLTHTGTATATGNLNFTIAGGYAPTQNLSANQATITAGGDISIGQEVGGTGTLTAPRVLLTTTAGSNGNINANLVNASDITLVADQGFAVNTGALMTNLDVTAQFDRAATVNSYVSASALASDLRTTDSQSFYMYNNEGNVISASNSLLEPWVASAWNIRYADTQATAVVGGVNVSVYHGQGGNLNVSMASDTDLTNVYVANSNYRAATVNLETGGSIDLSSVRTNGGAVTALSRGSDTVTGGITVGNVITDAYGTAGNVSLTTSKGDIIFESPPILEVPNRGISTSAQVDATPMDNPYGTVTLRAPLGSIGVEGAGGQVPVSYATALTLEAANTIHVGVTGALTTLNVDASADVAATGSIRVGNTSFVNQNDQTFQGLAIDRVGGNFQIAGVQGDAIAPGNLTITARNGGIAVTDDIGSLASLTLNAAGGDLLLQAAGGALNVNATGAMNLTASRDLLISAGSVAGEQVWVTAGTMNLQAGQDLSILADGASAHVSTSTGSTSYQTVSAGRDFTIRGGTAADAHAEVNFFGGHYQQMVDIGRDFTVQGGSGANAYASFGVQNVLSYQYFNVDGNVSVSGGSGSGAHAAVSSAVNYQYDTIGGDFALRAGTGDNAKAEWLAHTGVSYQSGSIGGDLIVEAGNAGSGQGAGAFAKFSGGDQRFYNIGGAVSVTGGSAAGNFAAISGTGTQELGTNYIYYNGGGTDSITVQGGSADGAYASIRTTGSQYLYAGHDAANPAATGDITITGGSGLNASAEVWAGSTQELGYSYNYYYYRPTRDVIISGGTGEGATATAHAGNSQYIYGSGTFGVRGGTGLGASAVVESGNRQEVGVDSSGSYLMFGRAEVLAGSGGIARLVSTGNQEVYTSGDIVVTGGSTTNMTASIESTAGNQTIGTSYNYYGAANPTDNITVQGGTGTGASAFISASTGQTIHAGGAITLTGGAGGANAELTTASGQQVVGHAATGYSNYYSYYYNNTDSITVTAAPAANARITSGGTQILQSAGDITFTSGAAATAQASAVTGQTVLAYGAINLTGGANSGTGTDATGLLVKTSGNQSVTAGTGITLTGGTGATDVLIQNAGAGSQSVSAGGQLTLLANGPSTGDVAIDAGGNQTVTAGTSIVLQAAGAGTSDVALLAAGNQSVAAGSSILLLASGAASNEVVIDAGGNQTVSAGTNIALDNGAAAFMALGATGTQTVMAQSMTVSLSGTQAGAFAGLSSGSDQAIVLSGDDVTVGSATLTLANTNTGAGSKVGINSGGRLDLTVSDSNYDTAGLVQVGTASGTGRTEITAATDMTIVAGALTIQGGATAAASSAVNAPNAMSISTLYGATQLLAGTAGSASIDPADLNIVSNGTFLMQGGGSSGADSTVVAGNFNLAATQGNLTLQNSVGLASIDSTNFSFVGNQAVNLNGGTISATGAGTVTVPGQCFNCSTNLIGNWTIDAYEPPPIDFVSLTTSGLMMLTDSFGATWELVPLEDGSFIITRVRRNQCV